MSSEILSDLDIAVAHFNDALDSATRDDKKGLVASMFLMGYYLNNIDPSDIEVDMPNPDGYAIVTWVGLELEPGTKAYEFAIDIDVMRRHP